jgi:two-component system phosphate regulon response regulator PhoB
LNQGSVLVVEDQPEIQQLISLHLRRQGLHVHEFDDGESARQFLAETSSSTDLVVMDWMLPGLSGIELTRWMRTQPRLASVPILFVTAKAEPEHIANGLDAGADDYLPKPFDTLVLTARVKALLRRKLWLEQPSQSPHDELRVGELVMNRSTHECSLSGQLMDLTRSEFRLLQSLMEHQGRVLSRENLIDEIQGEGVNVVGRTVDTHVFGLRKKLGSQADMIETIRGVGYRVRYLTPNS